MLFVLGLLLRLGNPDLWQPWMGGEKPMNFAIFNSVLKAVYFPPNNPWLSGYFLNYYYYGYVLAAIPTKILGIVPSFAFQPGAANLVRHDRGRSLQRRVQFGGQAAGGAPNGTEPLPPARINRLAWAAG